MAAKSRTRIQEPTPKQRAFAMAVASGAKLTDAYKSAYNTRATGTALRVAACRSAKSANVRLTVSGLQAETFARHRVTTDTLLAEAEAALGVAQSKGDASAMAGCIRLKAQLTGLLVKERDNARAPLAEVPDEHVHAELARLRAERESHATDHMAGVETARPLAASAR